MAWYPHTVTVAATAEPVTMTDAKAQTRVISQDDDWSLNTYIASARAFVEKYCGTPLVSRTITVKCDAFADLATFPVVPLVSVSSVSYVDSAGATQDLSAGVYEVRADGLTASLALKYGQSWPAIQAGSRITVTAVVGYSAVPSDIKHAILLLITQGYDDRADPPMVVDALLTNHRNFV